LGKPSDSSPFSAPSRSGTPPGRRLSVWQGSAVGILAGLFLAVPVSRCQAQQPPVSSVYGQAPAGEPLSAGQPERIVAAMLAELGRMDSISARVRQRTRVGNRVLVGTGRYLQQGRGEDQRFRLETVIEADTERFELLELSDGLSFWNYRKRGEETPRLERVDIARVRSRLEQLGIAAGGVATPYLGGVQRSLARVRQWFRFTTAEAGTLEGLPVWRVEGRWNPQLLAAILPEQSEAATTPEGLQPAQLPAGMPWSVELVIGSGRLFPFRVEWRAAAGGRPIAATSEVAAFSVLEFYDVRINEPVDSAAFVYRPSPEGLVDMTETFVKQTHPLRP
jgi:hypothetical protein